MNWVKEIASSDQNIRRNSLLTILRQEDLPYVHYHEYFKDNWIDNIVVPINVTQSSERIVIGAHYDSVEGSTGANDNAAAVSILIRLAKKLINKKNISADIVFFDREEYGWAGSRRYIEMTNKENIKAMINLDMCGYGDCIAIATKNYKDNPRFSNFFNQSVLSKHPVHLLDALPGGDDGAFEEQGIPNISIAILPTSDINIFGELANVLSGKEPWIREHQDKMLSMKIMRTFHNADMDSIEIIQEKDMNLLFNYLGDCLL